MYNLSPRLEYKLLESLCGDACQRPSQGPPIPDTPDQDLRPQFLTYTWLSSDPEPACLGLMSRREKPPRNGGQDQHAGPPKPGQLGGAFYTVYHNPPCPVEFCHRGTRWSRMQRPSSSFPSRPHPRFPFQGFLRSHPKETPCSGNFTSIFSS